MSFSWRRSESDNKAHLYDEPKPGLMRRACTKSHVLKTREMPVEGASKCQLCARTNANTKPVAEESACG